MFSKVVTATAAGRLELPGGAQFSLAPLTSGARYPVVVKPNGLDGEAFEYSEERTLGLKPFTKLEVHNVAPGSTWLAYVAGPQELIGRAERKAVQIFSLRLKYPFALAVPEYDSVTYALPSLVDELPPSWDLTRFSKVLFSVQADA